MSTRLLRLMPAIALLVFSFAVFYRDVVPKLIYDWGHDDNYSHGFLIVPIALYFAWERRDALRALTPRPSVVGLLVVIGSAAVMIAGLLGAELFLTRISIVGMVIGTVLFLLGWRHLRLLAFPIAFLLLMIPLPAIIFNQIAFPLQLLASRVGETTLTAAGIPVLREGNVIVLAHTTLEVAEACSGIRSLISLITLAIVFGYVADRRNWVRVAIALSAIPIAVMANGFRVAGTGVAAHYYGAAAAEGFFHTFSGWLVFVVAFGLMLLFQRALLWIADRVAPKPAAAPAVAAAFAAVDNR